jgi:uncharacterized protein (DUF2062 family)
MFVETDLMTASRKKSANSRSLAALHPARVQASLLSALQRIRGGILTRACIARSVGWGLFVGCLPTYGFHSLLCLAPARWFRVDPLIAYAAANISIPPMIPVLLYVEVQIGSVLLGRGIVRISSSLLQADRVSDLGFALLLGSLVLGGLVALTGATAAFYMPRLWSSRRKTDS